MLQWSVLKGHDGMIVVDLGQTETRVMKMSCNRVVLSSLRGMVITCNVFCDLVVYQVSNAVILSLLFSL